MAFVSADTASLKFCEADIAADSSTEASSVDDNRDRCASDLTTFSEEDAVAAAASHVKPDPSVAIRDMLPMKIQLKREGRKSLAPFSIRNTFIHVDELTTVPVSDRQQRSSTAPTTVATALADLSDSEDEADENANEDEQSDDEGGTPTMCKTKTHNSFEGTPNNVVHLTALHQQHTMPFMLPTFVPAIPQVWPHVQGSMFPVENLSHLASGNNAIPAEFQCERTESSLLSRNAESCKERKIAQASRPSVARRGGRQPQIALQCGDIPTPADPTDTTVVLRNLPLNYKRSMLTKMIDCEGFAGEYDFIYLPVDSHTGAGLGYAFINLVSSEVVPRFWRAFDGYTKWIFRSAKVCSVSWSVPHQGLAVHIKRFRNSPIMHESVPDEHKPMLFQGGVRTNFPPPTRQLCAPTRRK